MLFDDFVMRQIQRIAALAAALAGRAQPIEEIERDVAEAYRSLLGMDADAADRLSAASVARLLGEARQVTALATLVGAHADLCAARGDADGALRRFRRALALLEHADDPELRARIEARLASF